MEIVQQSIMLGQDETDATSGTPSTVTGVSATIACSLLDCFMTMGGLDEFINFAHHPLLTLILASQYMEVLLKSHYKIAVVFLQGTSRSVAYQSICCLNDEGRMHLDASRNQAEAMLNGLGGIGGRMEQVREALAGIDSLDPSTADELHRARYGLKHSLLRARNCTPAEARHIDEILDDASKTVLCV